MTIAEIRGNIERQAMVWWASNAPIGELSQRAFVDAVLLVYSISVAEEIERLEKRVKELEERSTGLDVKYGRDHSSRITVGELVDKFLECDTDDRFCDVFDEEFLFGCHKHTFDGPEHFYARKDVRGIVWEVVKRLKSTESAK